MTLRQRFGKWRHTQQVKLRFLRLLWSEPAYRRYILTWIQSQQRDYLLNRPMPWLAFEAVNFIEKHRPSQASVFEYGSGGSTLYWLTKGCTCVSVEHDKDWYHKLLARFASQPRIDYRFVPPEPGAICAEAKAEDPNCYQSANPTLHGFNFHRYATVIDEYHEAYFDVVLIDGRARPSCIMHGAKHVKVGGLLILDNAERAYYTAQTSHYLADFEAHHFMGPLPVISYYAQTSVYIRQR